MNLTQSQLQQLNNILTTTTVIKITDSGGQVIVGSDPEWDLNPQQLHFESAKDVSELEPHWESIWDSFGDQWNDERQMYRYLWSEVRSFFQAFSLYRSNYNAALNLSFDDTDEGRRLQLQHELNCELSINSMYQHGKQACDLIQSLANSNLLNIDANMNTFMELFSETRNKFLTHYHNPSQRQYPDFMFEPDYWSTMGTGSYFRIKVHIRGQTERICELHINHLVDYFELEKIFHDLITRVAVEKA